MYTPLLVLVTPWEGESMDFVVGCLEVNREWFPSLWWLTNFQKWLIKYSKSLLLRDFAIAWSSKSRLQASLSIFWRTLWKKLGFRLQYSASYHPQMNGQIEFVNKSLGDSLSCLVGENPKQWEAMVVQAEFAYNYSRN